MASYELSAMGGGVAPGGSIDVEQVVNPAEFSNSSREPPPALGLSTASSLEPPLMEPEPEYEQAAPEGLQPEYECTETTQVIGVDENSPVAWSADASLLAFAARDYGIYIAARTRTGFTVATTLVGSRSSVKKLEFHPSRKLLVSGCDEGIKLWAVFVDGSSNNPASQSRLSQSIDHDATTRTHDAAVETVHWL